MKGNCRATAPSYTCRMAHPLTGVEAVPAPAYSEARIEIKRMKIESLENLLSALIDLRKAREARQAAEAPKHSTADLVNAIDFTKVPTEGVVLVRVDPEKVCRHQANDIMEAVTSRLVLSGSSINASYLVTPANIKIEAMPDEALAAVGLQRIPGFNPAAAAAAAAH